MGYVVNTKWYKEDVNTKWLLNNGFKYSKEYSDVNSDAYIYSFPIYKYKFISLYECILILYTDNGEVTVKVQDRNRNLYPQFYYDSQNNHTKLVEKMENVILKELHRLDIKPMETKKKDGINDE